jgi:hypothetical protein
MKKILALLLLTLSLSASAASLVGEFDTDIIPADQVELSDKTVSVFLYPNCYWNPASGQCTLTNYSGQDVVCHFTVRARSLRGYQFNGYQYRVLYRGMSAWAYVYANNPSVDPIVHMTATAQCNTLN